MSYTLKMTEKFEKKFYKLIPKQLQAQTWNRLKKLTLNPYIRKPLGYKFIRELKLDKFRIYFVVFDNEILILLVDISDKKNQQEVIDSVYSQLEWLKKYVKNLN